jgi:hypothetical protein
VLASVLPSIRRLLSSEGDAESDPPTAPQPRDPRFVAIDKVRDNARWLILAFAAIGAALAGTAPLSNIGKLAIGDWRLWVAAGAAALGLGGIALAIWATANVLAPVSSGLTDFIDLPVIRRIFNEHFELLDGHGTNLREFKSEYDDARARYLNAVKRVRQRPSDAGAAAHLEAAKDDFYEFTPIVSRISTEGLLATVRARFQSAQPRMFLGAFVAALAIVAFAWAANPPKASPTKPQRVPSPLQAIEPSTYGSGVSIGPRDATRALEKGGVGAATAAAFIQSFSGPLVVETVRPGSRFMRYGPRKTSDGRFLTLANFADPQRAIRGLHLPWSNSAVCRQVVAVRRPTLVLVGGIAGGRPGLRQFLILDPHAFSFGKGTAYSHVACS